MNNHRPRKSLGQHFLEDRAVIDRILAHFDPRPDDVVVEIGPGTGALTYRLLPRVGLLHVVELDRSLAERLRASAAEHTNLQVHHADVLTLDLCALAPGGRIRIIGNLPYNISTPLLFRLLAQKACIEDLCLMLQKEVGDRILAGPGSRQYGRLSVMIQHGLQGHRVLDVAPAAFRPPPRVDSVVLHLVPYCPPPHPATDPRAFETVVRVAFSQRRKTLRNALKNIVDGDRISDLGIDPTLRPEQLAVQDYVRLSELL